MSVESDADGSQTKNNVDGWDDGRSKEQRREVISL